MIDPWFLEQVQQIVLFEKRFAKEFKFDENKKDESYRILLDAKRMGFSDARIAKLVGRKDADILALRNKWDLHPKYSRVDTCAAEFESNTPYLYSSYWATKSELPTFNKPVAVIGSGPNRIGQGIEFDYSCVRGVKAIQRNNTPVIMINSNPETVSTDYDTSDLLFFEPLTAECVTEVLTATGAQGFISQLGGQTPINITKKLLKNGFNLLGSTMETIDLAEDRGLFSDICKKIGLRIPKSAMVGGYSQALEAQADVGFPMICRPSFVLGGRRMEVLENPDELKSYFERHKDYISDDKPCLMDQFLEGALEVDVDIIRGKDWNLVGGIIEHIEAAGVHSGDSMGVIPPQRLKDSTCEKIEELSRILADEIKIIGFMNLQMAIKDDVIYVLEANPRSSRSVPFIAKATGIPLVDLGVEAILGKTKKELNLEKYNWRNIKNVCVKGVVFPFKKFSESDSILGPEMKSTGESMGRGADYSEALMKAFISSHVKLPSKGEVFFSLREKDKDLLLPIAREIKSMGYQLSATTGTAAYFNGNGLECTSLRKVHEGRPHCVDHIRKGNVSLVINTTTGRKAIEASFDIRRACIDYSIPCITESDASVAFLIALKKRNEGSFDVTSL